MARNGKAADPPTEKSAGERMGMYLSRGDAERFRRYCLKHGISFSFLATVAITYFIEHRPPPKTETLRLPTGRRLKAVR